VTVLVGVTGLVIVIVIVAVLVDVGRVGDDRVAVAGTSAGAAHQTLTSTL
jgi:hypothetical protein